MAALFQPPPTYAEVVLVDPEGKRPPRFNPIWLKWFLDVAAVLSASGGASGAIIHNDLSTIQGGSATERYHLSQTNAALFGTGTAVQVLHGGASPAWGAVVLTTDVNGDLPYANLTQGSALSVLGVTGNATADVASIAAGTDHQVLRRSGTALAFGALNLAQAAAITGVLPIANGGGLAGVYTPTLTNVANLSASTAAQCQYLRVGSVVNVSGVVAVDPTIPGTATQLGISLPIASNIGAVEDCGGTAFASGIAGQGAAILGDAANDRAEMQWISGDVTNQSMYFTFQYRII